jgi:hypothetical protein
VKPETVVGWHRAGFRLFWKWQSRPRAGRPKVTADIRALIRRLAEENPTWGGAQDPWRTSETGLRRFRTNRSPIFATCPAPR